MKMNRSMTGYRDSHGNAPSYKDEDGNPPALILNDSCGAYMGHVAGERKDVNGILEFGGELKFKGRYVWGWNGSPPAIELARNGPSFFPLRDPLGPTVIKLPIILGCGDVVEFDFTSDKILQAFTLSEKAWRVLCDAW